MAYLADIKLSDRQIRDKRQKVRDLFIKQSQNIKCGNISRISVSDLQLLFKLYDEIFFENYINDNFKGDLVFSLSTRMTKAAAKTIHPRNLPAMAEDKWRIEIRVGVNLFFEYYQLNRAKEVSGIVTRDALEAFQIVFEHELCHFIELLLYKYTNCRKERFKNIANGIFGHTKSYHNLPTNYEIAGHKYGLKAGDSVTFTYKGKPLKGFIYRINKRATVMVANPKGEFIDSNGKRYTKYYVPLECLH